ncbi:hypothetical protein Cst_c15260 [Thermoclostridium stercorarium subsp. stercorarium DSM 8532]|uniref:Uncharacterized protein n=1 Tax=Thermoclostridium stercorarium (strain ATCC 35414 / DSM 8532 / NCIMB 11754) TaxID=1121335 RepID=L7VSH7_THES1|nr:hypothetical protein Cst_c15260 [Thermoclostridium stercorarium subsp. stercorarium DSM 8532]
MKKACNRCVCRLFDSISVLWAVACLLKRVIIIYAVKLTHFKY